jgi:PhnB protein
MTTSTSKAVVQPYLFFGGHCEEALNFYREAIGAEVQMLMRFKDSPEPSGLPDCFNDKIMHSTVRVGTTTFMASDGRCDGPPPFEGFSLSVTVPDDTDAERVFDALSQKGTVVTPLEKTFWTSKFGMLEDRFGVSWMVSVEQKA